MSVDILGTSWDQCRSMVHYSFMSTETRRLVRTDSPGQPPRLSHSSWTMRETIRTITTICTMDREPRMATLTFTQFLSSEVAVQVQCCFAPPETISTITVLGTGCPVWLLNFHTGQFLHTDFVTLAFCIFCSAMNGAAIGNQKSHRKWQDFNT